MIHKQTECRACGHHLDNAVLSLGDLKLTGVFIKPEDADPPAAPLDLMLCENCGLLQLSEFVEPSELYRAYWYRSGTNQSMRDHLKSIVAEASSIRPLSDGDTVIDIGCNDGTLLSHYPRSVRRIGCDPSNAVDDIDDPSLDVVNDFFSKEAVERALGAVDKAAVITSISMFYDLNDPSAFVRDVSALLRDDGVWLLEMNYTGNIIDRLGFDMISHEHVTYYTLTCFTELVEREGLHVNSVSFNPVNGGSIRIFVSHSDERDETVKDCLLTEGESGMRDPEAFARLELEIDALGRQLVGFLQEVKTSGGRVALYGASTRVNTVLQHFGIGRDLIYCAAERSPGKYGLEMAGSRIPILPEKDVRGENPEYMLIGPYYFLDEFLVREREYLEQGGTFLVALPTLKRYSLSEGEVVESDVA